jgi:hypothetical protein
VTDGVWGKDGFGVSRLDGREFASIEGLGDTDGDDDSGKQPSER